MFEGPVYTVLSPSLYSSCLWRKGWGLWRQNMAFSASPAEEVEISLEMRQKQGAAILNSLGGWCILLTWWQSTLSPYPWDRLSWQWHIPAVGLSHFQPPIWCGIMLHSVTNILLQHILHVQDLYLSRSSICLAVMGWLSLKLLTSMWKTLQRKMSETGKQTAVLWAQTREEIDSSS